MILKLQHDCFIKKNPAEVEQKYICVVFQHGYRPVEPYGAVGQAKSTPFRPKKRGNG